MKVQHPKVVVIGAGSFFFGRPVIWNMAKSPVLRNGTLALVDTDPAVLKAMMGLARRAFDAAKVPVKLEGSTSRRKVLRGADFVVLSFSDKNAHYRGVDCEVSEKYGVRMCSGDTIGPGGVFRALREIPTALAVARDVSDLAPDAWLINFVNPTTVLGIALMRHARVRSFALCDGHHEPYNRLHLLTSVGILPADAVCVPSEVESKLDLRIGGVNHFTWVTRFNYGGKDMMPIYRSRLVKLAEEERRNAATPSHPKERYNATYSLDLFDVFGAYPDCIGHTKEYVPFYQGKGKLPDRPEPIQVFDAGERQELMTRRWKETEEYATGARPIERFLEDGKGDHATDIIESMWGKLGKVFYVNTANRGAVPNLPDDAFLELRCALDMRGPTPLPLGDLPRGVLGMSQKILDTHELTVEAAMSCDRGVLLRALATDPLTTSLTDARAILAELLERERPNLDRRWYR